MILKFSGEQLINFLQKALSYFLKFVRKINKSNKIIDGSIVIISLHKLGDTVFTIPAINRIQKYYNKKITIYCFTELVPIYEIVFKSFEFCIVERIDFYLKGRIAGTDARNKLRNLNPEIIFDLTGAITSASLLINTRATNIIGMNKEYLKGLYDLFTTVSYKSHLTDIYSNVTSLIIKRETDLEENHFLSTSKKIENIIIHPFAGWNAKQWGLKKFIELGFILKQNYDVTIITPLNSLPVDVIAEIRNNGINFIELNSTSDLVEILKDCSLVIGNDSGPIHIASLLGKATFTIYGPTNPTFHLPKGDQHGYCLKTINCSPKTNEKVCFTNGGRFGCPSFECMNNLSLKEVLEKLLIFIKDFNSNLETM